MIQARQDDEKRCIDENDNRIDERIIAVVPYKKLKSVEHNCYDSKNLEEKLQVSFHLEELLAH